MRDLNELAVFSAVVRHGGFTAAAKALGLQKSTMSRMVSRLEERLETRLLLRTSRQLSVTEAGRVFLERCDEGLRLLDAAEGVVEPVEPAGTVRITAMPDFAERFIAPLVGQFAKAQPRVQVELILTTRLVDLVEERIDLAIRSGPLPDSSLVARRIGTARRCLVASPAYLEARGRPRSVSDLARHDCLAYRTIDGSVSWRLITPTGPRNVRLEARLAADDFTVLRDWALAGLGISMLPGFVCEEGLKSGELVPLLRSSVQEEVPLFLVHPQGRHLPSRVRLLHDFLVAWMNVRS
ncbi:MAG: LysR family transcriptional regulator [Myxococcales bacterium]|nr:LysR family transcriptional regulator [Myxococcales bacterium]